MCHLGAGSAHDNNNTTTSEYHWQHNRVKWDASLQQWQAERQRHQQKQKELWARWRATINAIRYSAMDISRLENLMGRRAGSEELDSGSDSWDEFDQENLNRECLSEGFGKGRKVGDKIKGKRRITESSRMERQGSRRQRRR